MISGNGIFPSLIQSSAKNRQQKAAPNATWSTLSTAIDLVWDWLKKVGWVSPFLSAQGRTTTPLTRNYQVREEMDRNVWKSQLSQEITYCVRLKRATVFRLLNIPSQNHSIDWIPNLV